MLRFLPVGQNLFLSAKLSKRAFLASILFSFLLGFSSLDAQTSLISRTVFNTDHCNNNEAYGAYLSFAGLDPYYTISDAAFVEYSDGSANLTGTITNNTNGTIIFHVDVDFYNRTFYTPANSPKASNCGNNDTSDWYYYTSTWGVFTGAGAAEGAYFTVDRDGPSFQIGTGANQTEGNNIFGACGWLDIVIYSQPDDSNLYLSGDKGDFNFNLSGDPLTECDNLTSGGEIGDFEIAGGPFIASTIENISSPSGGSGTIQYMWLKTTNPELPLNHWDVIDGAKDPTLEPGIIEETTYFLRCSRRLGCIYWLGESNIIAKIINGDGVVCVDGAEEVSKTGNIASKGANNGVANSDNILGAIDEEAAEFYDKDDNLIIQLDETLEAGDQLTLSWKGRDYNSSFSGDSRLQILESEDGINFTINNTYSTSIKTFYIHNTITLQNNARYLKLVNLSTNGDTSPDFDVDAISYNIKTCIESGSIGDQVWEDLNGNGLRDDNEPGIQGVFVFLEDEFGNTITNVTLEVTDAEGKYLYEDLPFGNYVVRFATPGGFLPTSPNKGGDDALDSDASFIDGRSSIITVGSGNKDIDNVDAGYVKPVEIVGIVWFDNDKDGLQENTVDGVEDVSVSLFDAGDDMIQGTADDIKVADDITDENGFYTFFNVIPGKYYVAFDESTFPLGYGITTQNIGSNEFIDSDANPSTGLSDVFRVTSGSDVSGNDAGLHLKCGFIPEVHIGDATCVGFPVDFSAGPDVVDYEYDWVFLDDITNPVEIGTSNGRTTDFIWNTPGEKPYKLTVTNALGCSVTLHGTVNVLSEYEAECITILPVELIGFTAQVYEAKQVLLKWSTAWEEDNYFFEIQRSADGERFETIGSVFGNGTSNQINNYQFLDETPFFGRNYYRLKQIDFNGTFDFSEVQSVVLESEDLQDLITYPNPTMGITTLRVVSPFEADATVEVVNSTGQIMDIIILPAGSNSIEMDLTEYQAGFYFLNVKYGGFKKLVHRVLKVRE